MRMNRRFVVAMAALAGAWCWQSQLLGAEQQPSAEGQRQPQWRQRLQDWRAQGQGNFDPQQMRARLGDRLKTMLQASDDEWQVIAPLVEDVVGKQGAVMRGQVGGMLGGMGMMLGRSGGAGTPEQQELRQVVEAENASAAEIKSKLANLREQRKLAETALHDAREKLRAVLTLRQEAQLVLLGILD